VTAAYISPASMWAELFMDSWQEEKFCGGPTPQALEKPHVKHHFPEALPTPCALTEESSSNGIIVDS